MDISRIKTQSENFIVYIKTKFSVGSGVLYNMPDLSYGYILTAKHVICKKITDCEVTCGIDCKNWIKKEEVIEVVGRKLNNYKFVIDVILYYDNCDMCIMIFNKDKNFLQNYNYINCYNIAGFSTIPSDYYRFVLGFPNIFSINTPVDIKIEEVEFRENDIIKIGKINGEDNNGNATVFNKMLLYDKNDLSINLNSGIYVVKITNGKKYQTSKLIVQ